jgi:hypothetical protein
MEAVACADAERMAEYSRYFLKPAASRLALGEYFLAGTPCVPQGGISKRVLGVAAHGVSGEPGSSAVPTAAGPVYEGQGLPSAMALGITQERIMVFGMNVASGRPNKVIYDIPIGAVAGVDSRMGRSVGMKKLEVEIALSNGAVLSIDVPREHVSKGEGFVDALLAARGSARPAAAAPDPVLVGADVREPVTQTVGAPTSPPGWHQVSGNPYERRYWDGTTWTGQMRWNGNAWVQV